MHEFKKIIYEKKGRVAYLCLNRPERLNAIDPEANHELFVALHDFKADANAWVMIITGAGERAFSAGADLIAMAEGQAETGAPWKWVTPFAAITRDFKCWKPMIAAVNGHCLGGGLEIALACDIRIAVEHATFGLPEIRVGLMGGGGGATRLMRMVPMAFAMEMLLTGNRCDAQTALRFGLISRVVPKEKLMTTAEEIANSILECAPLGVRSTKEAAYKSFDASLEEGLKIEAELTEKLFVTADAKEGPVAFKEKRKPNWKAR